MAGSLGLAMAAMVAGCAKGDRTSGQYIDDRLTARKVKSELKSNPIYKFDDVNVNVYRGVVQLSGWVEQTEQKQIAEQLAKNVPGVVDVVNNVSLKPDVQVQVLTPTGESRTGRPVSEEQQQNQQQQQRLQEQNQ